MQGISTPACLEAERAAIEADAQVVALEQAVIQGDEKVTAAQIASQRDLAAFAKLRLESTRRKAEQLHEQQRREAPAGLGAKVCPLHRCDAGGRPAR